MGVGGEASEVTLTGVQRGDDSQSLVDGVLLRRGS